MKYLYVWIVVSIVVLIGAFYYFSTPEGESMNKTTNPSPTAEPQRPVGPPTMEIDPKKSYTATLETTEGNIVIALAVKETPVTVNNFVVLSRKGFYANTIFHRVIQGFMIQGGDPTGTGSGGPGYQFDDEPFTGEYTRGTVAMANRGPDTNGSQFFIMHGDMELDPAYVIFGNVIEGMNVVDTIATAETISNGGENSKPVTPVVVKSVSITER